MKNTCALLGTSLVQESDNPKFKHEFGAHAGFTTGVGLSSRLWFDRIGVQLIVIPIEADHFYMSSVGFSGMPSLKKSKYLRASLY